MAKGDVVLDEALLAEYRKKVRRQGSELYRDLPWRRTRDPYEIWISEVMLQQTQVSRVDGRWQRWLERFPSVDALAAASSAAALVCAFDDTQHRDKADHCEYGYYQYSRKIFRHLQHLLTQI